MPKPKIAIREKKEDYKTSNFNILNSTSKVITEPVPGNMYIALEDGRLVPIKSSQITQIVSSPGKLINQNLQEVSTSGDEIKLKDLPIKIAKSISISPELTKEAMVVQTAQRTLYENKPQTSKIVVKRKSDNVSDIHPNKKINDAEPELSQKEIENYDIKAVTDHIDVYDLSDNEDEELNDLFTDNNSLTESGEDEYTTPEYLYDEPLDDGNGEDNTFLSDLEYYDDNDSNVLHEEANSNVHDSRLASLGKQGSDEEINEDKKVSCENPSKLTIAKPTVILVNTPKATRPDGILKHRSDAQSSLTLKIGPKTSLNSIQKSVSTPQCSSTRKFAGTTKSTKTAFSKIPRINERFPDLPIPTNINQYGDCLKTKLGRYHYGLTLNDPPTQFFQGVLKGASGQTLAAMFGDSHLISRFDGIPLEDLSHLAIDTTFRVIPDSTIGVNHVMTISLLFNNQTYPLWYAITSCSSTELYKRILIEFQQHALDWPFKSILLNDDPMLCKAILAVFPDIELYGSWYFYCYSIWKEIIINNLTERCKQDTNLMTAVKLLMVVPYLPPLKDTPSSITMFEGFQVVKDFARENKLPKEFFRVMDYVAAFWFNIVKTNNFTTYGKHTCALNFVEITQLALLAYMKPKGNVWNLTQSFQCVAKMTSAEFDRYLNGKPPVLKKNRGRRFNVRIRQNMKRLQTGNYNVKKFLEMSIIYCEEMLDIFLHPLYPTSLYDKSNYIHTEGWKIKIIDS
ncbi:uncharacterized protein LOC124362490 [Homalodisca vitripennis]|uniref:uncharacterized protein LOC124362490 n=1 Tax=Homalodisca vitripennis TaxID=197043 RepID=UPI001EEB762F|nr:uncharacterized protein LOC124362490 [Homalodisca vitripennis]XP_046672998.1 uncharacterized protein LOC124362490 [Homalodisca vitripennis]